MEVEVLQGGYKGFKQWARGLWTLSDDEAGKEETLPKPPTVRFILGEILLADPRPRY
jgi:hypothetical protein